MSHRKGYIFTNKEHTQKGIMSTILGVLSIITLGYSIYSSYSNAGVNTQRYAAASLLAAVFSLVGLTLGILSTTEKDKFHLFSILGILFNIVALALVSLILYAGV